METYVITIARQFASMGRSIAQKMSEELGIEFYDRDIVEATAKRMGQPVSVISEHEEHDTNKFFRRQYPLGMGIANMQDEIFSVQTNIIGDFIDKGSCIIVGRCAQGAIKDPSRVLSVYIYAPYEVRFDNCVKHLDMSPKLAKKMIKEVDKAREQYRHRYCSKSDTPFDGYDLMIDSSRFGVDGTAEILMAVVKERFMTDKA